MSDVSEKITSVKNHQYMQHEQAAGGHLHEQAYFKPALISAETRRRQMPEPTDFSLPPGASPAMVAKHKAELLARRKEIDRCLREYTEKELDQVRQLVKIDMPAIAAAERRTEDKLLGGQPLPRWYAGPRERDLREKTAAVDDFNVDLGKFDRIDSLSERQRVLHMTNLFAGEHYLDMESGHLRNTSRSAFELSAEKREQAWRREVERQKSLY